MKQAQSLQKEIRFDLASLIVIAAVGVEILFQVVVIACGFSDTVRTWVVVVGNQFVFFLTCLFFTRARKISLAELTSVKRLPKPYFFPLFLLIAVLCVTAFAPLAALVKELFRIIGYSYTPKYYVPFDNGGLFALALLALTILPAVGEETMMRGVLLSGAKKKSPLFGVVYTALVFALFHGNLVQLVHQFLLGLVMGYLVLITRSVWASAAVHAVNNACALVIEYMYAHDILGTRVYAYFVGNASAWALVLGILSAVALLVGALALVTFLVKRERDKEGARLEGKGVNAYLRYLSNEPEPPAEEGNAPQTQSYADKLSAFSPVALVVALAVLLLSNVLTEVLK